MSFTIIASAVGAVVPSVKLTVVATGTSPTIPLNALLTVTRVHADGSRHQVLTEQGPRLSGGAWTWLDIHVPYNQAVTYEAAANGQTTTTAGATWILADKAYLIHSAIADLAVRILAVESIGERRAATRSAQFVPIGGRSVFLTDGYREDLSGSIDIRVLASDEASVHALFADDSVVLFNSPNTAGWDLGWMWMQPDDVSFSNPADKVYHPNRTVTIGYRQAADPIADLEPAWSSADASRYWSTIGGLTSADVELVARYATSLDFVTDTRSAPAWSSAAALAYWGTISGLTSAEMVARYATSLDLLTDTRL